MMTITPILLRFQKIRNWTNQQKKSAPLMLSYPNTDHMGSVVGVKICLEGAIVYLGTILFMSLYNLLE
jgi:hypothetical protein